MVETGGMGELMGMVGMVAQPDGLVRVVAEVMVGMDLNRNRVALGVGVEMVDYLQEMAVMVAPVGKAVLEQPKVALVGTVEVQGY
jgi:hypothetical protein